MLYVCIHNTVIYYELQSLNNYKLVLDCNHLMVSEDAEDLRCKKGTLTVATQYHNGMLNHLAGNQGGNYPQPKSPT